MVGAHRAAGQVIDGGPVAGPVERGVADGREHVAEAADVGGPVVVGVVEVPVLGQVLARVVPAVGDLVRHRLRGELARGPRPEDVGQELPAGLGLDRRTDADEAAARREVRPTGRFLRRVQGAAGRIQEDDGAVPGELRRVEHRRIGV